MDERAVVQVRVKPGAKRASVVFEEGVLRIAVRERAIDGAANRAAIATLAKALGVAPSSIEILRGEHAPFKRIAFHGITREEMLDRLR